LRSREPFDDAHGAATDWAVEAREVVAGIVLEVNCDDPRLQTRALTMSQLIEHYRRRELSVDKTW
jgi:hypothetical protein